MDLLLRNARVRGHDKPVDIAVHNGLIHKIAPKLTGRDHDFVSLKELGPMGNGRARPPGAPRPTGRTARRSVPTRR